METSTELTLNKDFADWVRTIKNEIRSAQLKAATKVNSELLHLYWHMGAEICEKQKTATWGDGWLKELSRELMIEFPSMNGFSYRNLRNMKQWYLFYNQENTIWQQAVAKLQDIFFSVPWGHHLYILSQCKTVDKAIFFLRKTVENGWSRAVLLNFLDTDLYERQGKAVSNFSRLLPDVQSDLAAQTLKDPYNFDFLTLTEHLGQLGVYISAINHQKKKPTDNPTIGLLICKDKNDVMVQYSLEASAYPIGISEYQLSQLMPEELKSQLPSIEEIESSIGGNM